MPTSDLRQAYLDVLMEQARSGRYPSPTMMDRVEATVRDRETAEEYVGALLDLLRQDRFPSPMMLERVAGLLDALDRAG